MRYLSISEVLELYERLIASSGGSTGIRDLGALESAVSQPHDTFSQQERTILDLDAGRLDRDGFTNWVKKHKSRSS